MKLPLTARHVIRLIKAVPLCSSKKMQERMVRLLRPSASTPISGFACLLPADCACSPPRLPGQLELACRMRFIEEDNQDASSRRSKHIGSWIATNMGKDQHYGSRCSGRFKSATGEQIVECVNDILQNLNAPAARKVRRHAAAVTTRTTNV